jgi:hypothetical protein
MLSVSEGLLDERWGVFDVNGATIPAPFMTFLVCWLTLAFVTFGLFAPQNYTVVAVLGACALSVTGAIFLTMDMLQPFQGRIRVSSEPMTYALARLDR